MTEPGVVDQNVNVAWFSCDLIKKSDGTFGLTQINNDRRCANRVVTLNLFAEDVQLFSVASCEDQIIPTYGKLIREVDTDATAGPSDYGPVSELVATSTKRSNSLNCG